MSDIGNKQIMADNILYYMNLNGKSRSDMCRLLGVPYTTFTDWVKAKTYPRIDKIELMSNIFGIQKSDLVEKKSDINEDTELSNDDLNLLRSLSPADRDILLSVARQMLKKENEQVK